MNNSALKKIYKRFKIISVIALALFLGGLLIPFFNKPFFVDYSLALSWGIGFWLLGDYEFLQVNRLYVYCLLFALVFNVYGFIANVYCDAKGDLRLFSVNLLLLLLIQRPLRLIFIFLFKREPAPDKPMPSFWDFIYYMLLACSFMFFPIYINYYFYGI
jgi:hypothetical protein